MYNLLTYILTTSAVFLFRYIFYGDIFPNTYYLKLDYNLLDRVKQSFQTHNLVLLLSSYEYAIPIGLIFLYNTYTGGDAWEHYGFLNRFLIVTIPMLLDVREFKELLLIKILKR